MFDVDGQETAFVLQVFGSQFFVGVVECKLEAFHETGLQFVPKFRFRGYCALVGLEMSED